MSSVSAGFAFRPTARHLQATQQGSIGPVLPLCMSAPASASATEEEKMMKVKLITKKSPAPASATEQSLQEKLDYWESQQAVKQDEERGRDELAKTAVGLISQRILSNSFLRIGAASIEIININIQIHF